MSHSEFGYTSLNVSDVGFVRFTIFHCGKTVIHSVCGELLGFRGVVRVLVCSFEIIGNAVVFDDIVSRTVSVNNGDASCNHLRSNSSEHVFARVFAVRHSDEFCKRFFRHSSVLHILNDDNRVFGLGLYVIVERNIFAERYACAENLFLEYSVSSVYAYKFAAVLNKACVNLARERSAAYFNHFRAVVEFGFSRVVVSERPDCLTVCGSKRSAGNFDRNKTRICSCAVDNRNSRTV